MLYHVVAMARNRVIGIDNKLPWHFPEDLKYFKNLTTGHTVIMGRKTHESIGRALPNRQNIVLSSRPAPAAAENVLFVSSLDEAVKKASSEKIFIIGGGKLFADTLKDIDGIYLTRIEQDYAGDCFYPEIPGNFIEKSRQLLRPDPLIEALYLEKTA